MTLLTISEASKSVGKSSKTLYRHLSEGKLSANKNSEGVYQFDTAELIRVYGELKVISQSGEMPVPETLHISEKLVERLENEVAYLRDEASYLRTEVFELRKLLEKSQNHNQQVSLGYKSHRFGFWDFFRKKESLSEK